MSTFQSLQTKVQNFFGQSDSDFTDEIKEAINDVIAEINDEVPQAEHLQATSTDTLTIGATEISTFPPSDFDHVLNVYLTDNDSKKRSPLIFLSRKEWNANRIFELGNGTPTHYTVWDSTFHVAPKPDTAYPITLDYFKFDTALSANSDTGSLTNHYSRWERLILEGVKSRMYEFLQDDAQMIQRSFEKYQREIKRFRVFTRRQIDKTPESTRVKNWKEFSNISISRVTEQFRWR